MASDSQNVSSSRIVLSRNNCRIYDIFISLTPKEYDFSTKDGECNSDTKKTKKREGFCLIWNTIVVSFWSIESTLSGGVASSVTSFSQYDSSAMEDSKSTQKNFLFDSERLTPKTDIYCWCFSLLKNAFSQM